MQLHQGWQAYGIPVGGDAYSEAMRIESYDATEFYLGRVIWIDAELVRAQNGHRYAKFTRIQIVIRADERYARRICVP